MTWTRVEHFLLNFASKLHLLLFVVPGCSNWWVVGITPIHLNMILTPSCYIGKREHFEKINEITAKVKRREKTVMAKH